MGVLLVQLIGHIQASSEETSVHTEKMLKRARELTSSLDFEEPGRTVVATTELQKLQDAHMLHRECLMGQLERLQGYLDRQMERLRSENDSLSMLHRELSRDIQRMAMRKKHRQELNSHLKAIEEGTESKKHKQSEESNVGE